MSLGIVLDSSGVNCVKERVGLDVFHINIAVILLANSVIPVCDDVAAVKVYAPLRIQLVLTVTSHNSQVFDVVVVQDVELSDFGG